MKLLSSMMLFMACFAFAMQAQSPGPVSATIQANNVKATISSDGVMFKNGLQGQFVPILPGLAERSLLRGSGFWVAGKDPAGNLRGAVTGHGQTDFKPGFIDGETGMTLDDLNNIWRITCSDISQHIADFQDNGVINNPNLNVYSYPGKGNPFFESYNNSILLPLTPQPQAGFFDRNETGIYEPNNGEYPCIEVRGCALKHYPMEQDWFVFNDLTDHPSGFAPLSMEVQAQVLMFKTADPSPFNNAIFVRYKTINRSEERIDSCYFGLFADFDIGNAGDDFIGTIPNHNILYGYNGDTNDEGGFDTNIPVMAIDLMRGPLDTLGQELPIHHMLAIENVNNLLPHQYFNLLSGRFADGTPAPNGGIMYPENPNIPGGNSELAAGNTPGQRAGIASYGPFTLLPGAVSELIVAYYFVHTPGASPLQNVQQLYSEANILQGLFDNCFDINDKNCDGLVPAIEHAAPGGLSVYPNPTAGLLFLESKGDAFNHIELTNLLGQQIRSIHLESPVQQYTLQTEGLPNGIYLLQMAGLVKPIVIQR